MSETQQTAMARETAEIPAVAERLLARDDLFAAIVERIDAIKPRVVVFCGRGSSGHAGVYLRYLFEARLGMLASVSAPSVSSTSSISSSSSSMRAEDSGCDSLEPSR